VPRRIGNPSGEIQFPIGHDAIANLLGVEAKPHRCIGIAFVSGWAVGVNSIGLQEQIVLGELGVITRLVDGVGFAAELTHDGKARDIAWTIRDVDHVLKGYTAILLGHLAAANHFR